MGLIAEFWRLVRFSLVGAAATAVYVLTAMAAVEWLHINPMIGATLGFCGSFAVSYVGHFHFTFAVPGRYRDYVVKFAVSSIASFLVSTAVMWFATKLFKIDYRIALVAVAVIIPICSYLVSRFWVFLHPVDTASPGRPLKTI